MTVVRRHMKLALAAKASPFDAAGFPANSPRRIKSAKCIFGNMTLRSLTNFEELHSILTRR